MVTISIPKWKFSLPLDFKLNETTHLKNKFLGNTKVP